MAKRTRILVIDDEPEICGFLKDLLTAEGYAISTATDPEKGLYLAEKLKPDLVLLDLKMPRMDGIEVLRRLKRADETIEVIIITGFGTMDSARAAMRLGAFDYITKPFDLAHVKALVKDALAYRIRELVERLKPGKGLLSEKQLAVLNSLEKCRPQEACFWEVAVKAFFLGDTQFMVDWTEKPSTSDKDKKSLKHLTELLNEVMKRSRAKPSD